jgi:hypothetical protein
VRFADVDLDEDEDMGLLTKEEEEEEGEEGDPDEFIDLLDVLDGKGEVYTGSDNEKRHQIRKRNGLDDEADDDEEQESEEESEEEQEDNDDALVTSDIEDDPQALEKFQEFISGLDTTVKKRKADDQESTEEPVENSRSHKRRFIAEQTEAGVEDEFRAHVSSTALFLPARNTTYQFYTQSQSSSSMISLPPLPPNHRISSPSKRTPKHCRQRRRRSRHSPHLYLSERKNVLIARLPTSKLRMKWKNGVLP